MNNHLKGMRRGERTIGDFITKFYIALCVDHDFLFTIYGDDLRGAVRVAGVIDQPSGTITLAKLKPKVG
jgi:hypothetical protein